jgi:uncharacterized repeat protein (TIGR01451 family)
VNIPTTVNAGFSGVLSNQANATGSTIPAGTANSDNVDNSTSGLPAGVTVPAGSLAQTQGAALDPTTANVSVPLPPNITLIKDCPTPANCLSSTQPPGTDLIYRIAFTNSGGSNAQSLVIVDPVPDNTDFKLSSVVSNLGTTGLTITIEYSSDYNGVSPGTATWTYTPTSGGGSADSGYDRNVKAIRWRVTAGNLSQTAPNNSGDVRFTVKIR